jgi:hypothetical protein
MKHCRGLPISAAKMAASDEASTPVDIVLVLVASETADVEKFQSTK